MLFDEVLLGACSLLAVDLDDLDGMLEKIMQ